MLAGEFDLSSIAVFTLGGLLAILCGKRRPCSASPLRLERRALIGALQGGVLAVTGAKLGATDPRHLHRPVGPVRHIVAGEGILSSSNYDIGLWLDDTVAVFFSPRSLIVLSLFLALWAVMRFTRIGIVLRAVGADRRAARSSGIATG